MARDHARIRLDIWTDDDWRDLSAGAQWLYMHLLSAPSMSFVGVADWRPARIAAHTADLGAMDVEMYAAELEHGRFILPDRDSEEVLVRSFVKHDGLLRQPNMSVALARSHGTIASSVLRAVVVDQMKALREADPTLKGWAQEEVQRVLGKRSMTFDEGLAALPRNPSVNPSGDPSPDPSDDPSGETPPTHLLTYSLPPGLPSSSSPLPETHQRAARAGA